MIRLTQQNLNSPEEYNRIFKERAKNKPNWQDLRRWRELIRYFKGGYVVDIGCLDSKIWDMVHTRFWKEQNYRYLGTDVAEECIKEMAKTHDYRNTNGESLCRFIVDDIYKSQIKDGIADYVVLGEILEHAEFPDKMLATAFQILKLEGILAISVPNNEAIEPGAVDRERHIFSYELKDIRDLTKDYGEIIKSKVLRSQYLPRYKYCFPQLLVWIKKYANI